AYEERQPVLDLKQGLANAIQPERFGGEEELQVRRGNAETALAEAPVKVRQTYETPVFHHNPIETGATIASWDGDRLTLHETTRWVKGAQSAVAHVLGMSEDNVRVICPFIGGAFGSKGFHWWHTVLAAL